MAMALDDYAKRLAAAKKSYMGASPTDNLEDIRKQGLQIRSEATGAGYDLNSLEDAANRFGGFKVDAKSADEQAFRQNTFGSVKAAPIWKDPTKTNVNSTGSPELKVGQDQKTRYSNPWLEDAQKLTVQLQKMMDTPFTFNTEKDPTYQAAKQLAQQGAKTATRRTQEEMNNRGLANSSITTSQMGQIEQQAQMEPLKLIPQLQQNAYAQHQQGIGNQGNLLNILLGTGLDQQKFLADETWKKTAATGQYLDPEAQPILDHLMSLKQAAENPLSSSADISRFSGLADQDRAKLSSLGLDETKFGSDVSYVDAMKNISTAGQMTLPAQQQLMSILSQNNQAYGGIPAGFSELIKQFPALAPLGDYFKGYEGQPNLDKRSLDEGNWLKERQFESEKTLQERKLQIDEQKAKRAAEGKPLSYEQEQQMNTDALMNYIIGSATDKADALKMLDDPEVKQMLSEKSIDTPKLRKSITDSYAADPKAPKPPSTTGQMTEKDVYDYAWKEVTSTAGYTSMKPAEQQQLWDAAYKKWSQRIMGK